MRRQTGIATLGATLVLLVLVTAIAIYTARSVLFEQRISGNDFRSRMAFEAAESGLLVALAYLSSSGGEDKDGNGASTPCSTRTTTASAIRMSPPSATAAR